MEGRTIVRPGTVAAPTTPEYPTLLQWRAGQLSGQACRLRVFVLVRVWLQWRAGQLSGQARRNRPQRRRATRASMEGRTIVRPGPRPRPQDARRRGASMEGRTIVRPGHDVNVILTSVVDSASMEGRTIVRPGQLWAPTVVGGVWALQWRAGQLSGQATVYVPTWYGYRCASMEGRTIVRPGPPPVATTRRVPTCFNGGPDNCPARRGCRRTLDTSRFGFNGGPDNCPARPQHPSRRTPPPSSFNGGPDNCPARLQRHCVGLVGERFAASMEGRTIVRPGPNLVSERSATPFASMEGRTIVRPGRRPRNERHTRHARFNGGPDNCPARHAGHRGAARARRQASMEGRTIVRPGVVKRGGDVLPRHRFNGGPDNCPARPGRSAATTTQPTSFNGGPDNCPARRPKVRTFRSATRCFNGGPDNCPARPVVAVAGVWSAWASMEGRTIVRPGCRGSDTTPVSHRRFNGGPDNCPARLGDHSHGGGGLDELQWRAGQLSGQAGTLADLFHDAERLQWRAGQLSGQATNQGDLFFRRGMLQWRAGQLSGQAVGGSSG